MKRSFRVSKEFCDSLSEIQSKSKLNGIIKSQEQILDEMMEVYMLYLNHEAKIFISEEMEHSLINIIDLYVTKQAQMHNAMLEHIDTRFDQVVGKVAK